MTDATGRNTAFPQDIFLSVIDRNGIIASANDTMLRKLELGNPQIHPTNFFDLVHPLDRDDLKKLLRQNKQGSSSEMELYVKNGTWHLMKWHIDALPVALANEEKYLCYGYEIPEEESQEPAGNDQSGIAASFVKGTPHMAWLIDEEVNLVFANEAFYAHFGKQEKDCINKKMSDIVPQAVMEALYKFHNQVFQTGEAVETIQKVKRANGIDLVSYIHIFPLEDADGKKLAGGQAINVPDKSKLEQELHDAHERFLNISRATSDAIWEWDMQSGVVFQNEKLQEMIGYRPDEAKGLSWWLRRIHPEDRNRVADKVKEVTEKQQQSWQNEYRFRFADDSYRYMQDKGFIIYENGLPVKMICSLQEVSHLKNIQNELAEEKVRLQKEAAASINYIHERERTRIAFRLQNSVNQLLSAAALHLDALVPTTKAQQEAKQQSVDYLKQTVDELRRLSKELATPAVKEEGLSGSIRNLVSETEMPGKLEIQFIDGIEEALISSSKKIALFRIVQEQLKNIIQHSQATCCSIVIETNKDAVRVVIEDNGNGFDPLQTHRNTGMNNIRERAEFYHGSVTMRSTPGNGCILIVIIPLGE